MFQYLFGSPPYWRQVCYFCAVRCIVFMYLEKDFLHHKVCNISIFSIKAKECKETKEGYEYNGTMDVTKDGITCQRWDSNIPHFPSIGIIEARTKEDSRLDENYCRAVDGHWNPWCYTTDPSIRWQECDIPYCGMFSLITFFD